jgi:sugar lactone lactonase YvrE
MDIFSSDNRITRLAEGLVFPESPRWHDGALWMVDMHAHKVLRLDPSTRKLDVVVHLKDDRPSAMGFQPDGTMLIMSARKRQLLKADKSGSTRVYCDLNSIPGDNFNDMVVDGQGRAYIGNRFKHSTNTSPSREGIVLVTTDGKAREVANDLYSPNGTVITPDGKTLIVGQSKAHKLIAFDVEADGSLTNRRLWANCARGPGEPDPKRDPSPDGTTLDADGGIWYGSPRTGEFLRVLEGGKVTDRVELPKGYRGVACMLGGPERRDLFLLYCLSTDEINASCVDYESELKSQSKGFVDVMTVASPGVGWP